MKSPRQKKEALLILQELSKNDDPPEARLEALRELLVTCESLEARLEHDALKTKQEPKYRIGPIVNRESGHAIPDDEPVFILRARDVAAVPTLESYLGLVRAAGSPQEHMDAVRKRIYQFIKFKEEHPDRMRTPDTRLTAEWENL